MKPPPALLCWLRSDTATLRHLVEYNGLTVEAHVTCDRVMSGSVTVIGHSPTVTIHNSVTDTPLSVSHAYCFHLIRYYNHHPFPMSPGSSSLPGILHVSDTPCHEWYRPLIGRHTLPWVILVSQGWGNTSVDMLMEGRAARMVSWGRWRNAWWWSHPHQKHHSLCYPS